MPLAAAQTTAPPPSPAVEQVIGFVQTNGIDRGEVVLLRMPDGDWWVAADDAAKLRIPLNESARRSQDGEPYYSLRALGALSLAFDEANLALQASFPQSMLPPTRIDLSNRPPPAPRPQDQTSLLLTYRLSVRPSVGSASHTATLQTDANLRLGPLLLRQETRLERQPGSELDGPRRGATQLIWDDLGRGARLVIGDTVSSAGAFGTTLTGAGVSYSRLFQLTPDVIRQPTATLQTLSGTASDIEVSVDGTTLYRGRVPPGPITLDNLLQYGGTRNVRITITDASGRREVIDQPFLFTDGVLARGLHEYNYFLGRRSNLDGSGRIRYLEPGWQAMHRYGWSDSLTVSAGGEGGTDFASGGAGATWRSDTLGLLAVDALASHDRSTGSTATGWSGRYTYQLLGSSLQIGRRMYGETFRSFNTGVLSPWLRSETVLGGALRLAGGQASLAVALQEDALGRRTNSIARYSKSLTPRTTLSAELQHVRTAGDIRTWAINLYLRTELEARSWTSVAAGTGSGGRNVELSAGRSLPTGEGFGWRAGTQLSAFSGTQAAVAFGTASWNTRVAAFDLYARAGTTDSSSALEGVASGAFVAAPGWSGWTRPVSDGFAVARLGVDQPGLRVFLNGQLQGRTDEAGTLLIPNVGSYSSQTLSLDESELPLDLGLAEGRKTFSIRYRGGAAIDFGARRLRAFAGPAWAVVDGERRRLSAQGVALNGSGGALDLVISRAGDFYVENAAPGRYTGTLMFEGRQLRCQLVLEGGPDPVTNLQEGLVCD